MEPCQKNPPYSSKFQLSPISLLMSFPFYPHLVTAGFVLATPAVLTLEFLCSPAANFLRWLSSHQSRRTPAPHCSTFSYATNPASSKPAALSLFFPKTSPASCEHAHVTEWNRDFSHLTHRKSAQFSIGFLEFTRLLVLADYHGLWNPAKKIGIPSKQLRLLCRL
jgi:hypothetical protein